MENATERLQHFSDEKLIDIVKNYRRYGYDEALRAAALSMLETRGISKEQLVLNGNMEHSLYEQAQRHYAAFQKNSVYAIVLYLTFIIYPLVAYPSNYSTGNSILLALLNLALILAFLIFFTLSYHYQRQFYHDIGKPDEAENGIVYFVLGMPFFALLFFYFKRRMREYMRLIR